MIAATFGSERTTTVTLQLPDDIDLGDYVVMYATIDQCGSRPPVTTQLIARLHSAGGQVREVRQTAWPAGWNRVAVDIQDWPERHDVVAIEVGLALVQEEADKTLDPQDDVNRSRSHAFHIGRIGISRSRRTW